MKKGDRIFRITQWDESGTVLVTEYTVSSWGKKQATLIETDGTNAEFRVYTSPEYNTRTLHVRVSEVQNIEELALECAAKWTADERAYLESILDNPMRVRSWTEGRIAKLHEPRVIFANR